MSADAPRGRPTARRIGADIAVQVVGRLGNLVLGVVVTLAVVRLLGEDGFGRWATILAVVTIAQAFADLGLEQVAVRNAAAEPEREREWLGAMTTLSAVLAVPATAACVVVLLLLERTPELALAGALVALTLVFAVPNHLRAVFQLRTRNDVPVAVLTLNSVLWAGGVGLVALTDDGIVALAAAFLAVNAATSVVQAGLALRAGGVRLRGSRERWRPLAQVAFPVGIATLLTFAYGKIDQVLVFELAGARDAGLYGAVYRVLDQAQFIPIAAMTTLFPLIAAAYPAEPEQLRALLERTLAYLAMASLPALAFAVAAAEPSVVLLFGEEFRDAAPALPILMGAFVSICFGYLAGNLVVVLGLQGRFLRYAILALVVNVALNLALVPAYGFVAAAWATLVTELLVMGLTARAVLRTLGWRPPAGRLLRVAGLALVLTGALAGLRAAGAPLGLLVAVAAVAWPAALLGTRTLRREELVAVLRKEPLP